MNALSAPLARGRVPRATSLRMVLSAGGWTTGLLVLAALAGPALARTGLREDAGLVLSLMLAATLVMFWAMLAGARLSALFLLSRQLRLPRVVRQAVTCLLVATALGVVLPAAAHALAGGSFALVATVLAAAAALGLLWVSMPPWTMWVLIGVGMASRWLPGLEGAGLQAMLTSPVFYAAVAFVLALLDALCWWWAATRQQMPGSWSAPIALLVARGARGTLEQQQQAQWNSPLFALDTPVGSQLRRVPQAALAIALGPGFGRTTLRALLATQGPLLAVAVFWLLLGTGTERHENPVGLIFAPLMVLSTAFAPALRLQMLSLRPAMGLHELALLPGLPRQPALALASQLGRQAILRALPALAIMAGFALAVDAPAGYLHLLLWTCMASLFVLNGATLLSLHSRPLRWLAGTLLAGLVLGLVATMMVSVRGTPPDWLLPAWSVALLGGVVLHGIAVARLKALPHPWLQA